MYKIVFINSISTHVPKTHISGYKLSIYVIIKLDALNMTQKQHSLSTVKDLDK
jgi:hypothetical protein